MSKTGDNLIAMGLAILGLILMATPLALWVAWSGPVLLLVLGIGLAAGVLFCILADYERPPDPSERTRTAEPRRATAADEVTEEIHGLHPFVYHNRLSATARFRAAMTRLRERLYGQPD